MFGLARLGLVGLFVGLWWVVCGGVLGGVEPLAWGGFGNALEMNWAWVPFVFDLRAYSDAEASWMPFPLLVHVCAATTIATRHASAIAYRPTPLQLHDIAPPLTMCFPFSVSADGRSAPTPHPKGARRAARR